MKKNVGIIDRLIRIALALIIIVAGFYYQSLWALVAIIPLVSGLSGFCPLYGAFGLSTRSAADRENDKAFDFK